MEYWKRIRQCFGTERFIITGAAGAILENNQILLVKNRRLNKWQIPGGLQEIGESVSETIQREIKEELNIQLKAEKLIGIYTGPKWNIEYPDGGKLQQVIFFFQMTGKVGKINIQKEEIEEANYFSLFDYPDNIMDCCREKIIDLQNYNGETIVK